ncbi:MAG TPA: ribose 5-phosphate isomerase B [Flavobacteriales bacterium]|nr:ribose 5-phosphate isomerase B [Flavobacteriales bacterium]
MKKIAIGSDHAGYSLKQALITYLKSMSYEVVDFGTNSEDRADYPDYAHPVAEAIERKEFEFAVLICGSANGISMTANKHQGVRCAICWKPEIATLARAHNDANIISFPARFITLEDAISGLNEFLNTKFEGGRHTGRVDKISC